MSKGKRSEVRGQRSEGACREVMAQALYEGINTLHAQRGALVAKAREQREAGERAESARTWELVTEITLQLEQADADLRELGGPVPVLRDPEADLPDHLVTVVVVTDHESDPVVRAYRDEEGWCDETTDGPVDGSVIGWCHLEDAAAALRAARKGARQ